MSTEKQHKPDDELESHSDRHWQVEYQVASDNWRHGDQLRESILKYWTTFTTLLIAAVGGAFNFAGPIPVQYVYWMCGLGFGISLLSLAMDYRENQYAVEFFKRCAELERLAGFRGQYVLTSRIHRNKLFSRRYLMRVLYSLGALAWIGILLTARCLHNITP